MNPNLLTLLVALLFILVFGGLPVLRKQAPSLQLAVEVLILTGVSLGAALLTGRSLDPVLFLILLYVVIMRCRLLVDLGNLLTSRGRHQQALSVYRLSMQLAPDFPARLLALISYSAVLVRIGALEEGIRILEEILEKWRERLHPRHESACHYNLGVAYMRMGRESRAVREFNQAIDAWPMSPYAEHAKAALKRRRSKGKSKHKEGNPS